MKVKRLLVAAVPLVVALAVTGCSDGGAAAGGCSSQQDALVAAMAKDPVLTALPSNASGVNRYTKRGCDEDDGNSWAGVGFKTNEPFKSTLARIDAAARANGWRTATPEEVEIEDPSVEDLCLVKSFGESLAFILLPEEGVDEDGYFLEIRNHKDNTAC